MSDDKQADVDFSEVAAEDPAVSVEHEHALVEEIADGEPSSEDQTSASPVEVAPTLPSPMPSGPAL